MLAEMVELSQFCFGTCVLQEKWETVHCGFAPIQLLSAVPCVRTVAAQEQQHYYRLETEHLGN